MAAETIYKVVVKGNQGGQMYRNILHFYDEITRFDETDPVPRLTVFAAAVLECFVQFIVPIVTSDVRITSCSVQMIWPSLGVEVEETVNGTDGQGEATGDRRTTFESMVVTKRANVGGRHGKGRIKLPSPPEDAATGDYLTAPQLTALGLFAACLVGKFVGAAKTTEYQLALLQRQNAGAVTALSAASVRPVVHLTVEDLIGSQRTRKVGVGR